MNINILTLDDEDLRIIANVEQVYDAFILAKRDERALPDALRWKNVKGTDYLYEFKADRGEPRSLGRKSSETEMKLNAFEEERKSLDERLDQLSRRLGKLLDQYRSLHLPQVMSLPAEILREMDVRQLIGTDMIIVGTTAFAAYEIEARERFAHGLDETEDFDLGWCRGSGIAIRETRPAIGSPLFSVIKSVDKSFRINREKPYQAINNHGFEVELLTAPSVMKTLSKDEVFSTAAIHEQEWLLMGTPVRHVVCGRDGSPAPLIVPDPRWMGLHKLWLSKKETRRADKKDKDAKQGDLLLDAVARRMETKYPMDADFVLSLPPDLVDTFNDWAKRHGFVPPNKPARYRWR